MVPIARLSSDPSFRHGDSVGRLIAAPASRWQAPLIAVDGAGAGDFRVAAGVVRAEVFGLAWGKEHDEKQALLVSVMRGPEGIQYWQSDKVLIKEQPSRRNCRFGCQSCGQVRLEISHRRLNGRQRVGLCGVGQPDGILRLIFS